MNTPRHTAPPGHAAESHPQPGTTAGAGEMRLPNLAPEEQRTLLQIAKTSIAHGLCAGRPLAVEVRRHPAALQEPWAVFVTLHRLGELRGCIGNTEASLPLAAAVAKHAWHAAFHDTRFLPLATAEFPDLDLQISILSPAVPMTFQDEAGLLRQLEPGVDGLLIEDGPCHATFLPSVWETLPDKQDFWRHLQRKAGLDPGRWSAELRASRYRARCFSAPVTALEILD